MHGLRREVLEAQTRSIGILLDILELPENPSMEEYGMKMKGKIQNLKSQNYTHAAFGDIFLEDLKKYREDMLSPYGIKTVFPLWKKNTKTLANDFLSLGYRAVIICINSLKLSESFLGEELTKRVIERLPENVDPCGENGEFHTLCFDGPIFNEPLNIIIGNNVFRTYKNPYDKNKDIRFGFCDIALKSQNLSINGRL